MLEHIANPLGVGCLFNGFDREWLKEFADPGNLVIGVAALVIASCSWITANRAARNDVLAQVRDWGGEVVHLLAEARGVCLSNARDPDEIVSAREELRCRASALVDRGRFFFPNRPRESKRNLSSAANQSVVPNPKTDPNQAPVRSRGGFRPPILSLVMVTWELVPQIGANGVNAKDLANAFEYLQSVFVGTMIQAVNFSHVPGSVRGYEKHLARIEARALPLKIKQLRPKQLKEHKHLLKWDPDKRLEDIPPRYPEQPPKSRFPRILAVFARSRPRLKS